MSLMPSNKVILPSPNSAKKRPVKRILLTCLALLGVILALIWFQRYALVEMVARHQISKLGYEADFSVTSIDSQHVEIEAIHVSRDGDRFFSADTLQAKFKLRDALKGRLISLTAENPSVEIAIDETGNITSKWLPESNLESSTTLTVPENGVTVNAGTLILESPYGLFETQIDAHIKSFTDMTAVINVKPQTLIYDDFQAEIGGNIQGALKGTDLAIKLDIHVPKWRGKGASGMSLSLTGDIITNKDHLFRNVDAAIQINSESARTPELTIGTGQLSWNGKLSMPEPEGSKPLVIGDWARGDWGIDIKNIKPQNDARTLQMAKALTFNETLSVISSSAPFAGGFTASINKFLQTLNFQARGSIIHNAAKTDVFLHGPLTLKGANQTISMTPPQSKPSYTYDPRGGSHLATFSADLTGPYGAVITESILTAQSGGIDRGNDTGFAVKKFTGTIKTKNTWRAVTSEERPARIAPLSARVTYELIDADTAPNAQPERRVTINSGIDFDGDVPGGYGEGLKARGALSLSLKGDALTARFRAAKDSPVEVKSLETASDWLVKEAVFRLANQDLIYKRGATNGRLTTQLAMGSGQLIHTVDARDLSFTFEDAAVSGHITDTQQDWDVDAENIHITSDTFPSPGTDIKSPAAKIIARLQLGKPIEFSIASPNTKVKTELVSAANLSVDAEGSTQDLNVIYGQGLVKFSAGQLPALPLTGNVRYLNEAWAGTAVTVLPGAEDAPIDITYTFDDGRGYADVVITDLPFKPSKLQPKHLLPAIAGMVSRVDGLVSSNIHIEFGTGEPLTSSGTAQIKNMSTGTLPGPITGMNAAISFSSFFPVETSGVQTLTIENFDPGFPLENGIVTFEIVPDGIKIHSAKWPLGSGYLSLEPTTWLYSAPQNRVVLAVEKIALGEFLKDMGGGRLKATGEVNGRLPVIIEGINVRVENGRLAVKDGGVIQYTSPQTDAAGTANQYAGYAFDALKNFEYEQLEAELNGALDGPMKLRLIFNGANPNVLYGSQFKFNVGVEGELLNILRSFQAGTNINSKILDQLKSTTPDQKAAE